MPVRVFQIKLNIEEPKAFLVIMKNIFCMIYYTLKLHCDTRSQNAFTACDCVFKVITLVGSNQRNYFENATEC